MSLEIQSPAFAHQGEIPARYTCQGEDLSPPLRLAGVPQGAKSLVLIVDDPDAPDPAAPRMVWDHWLLFDLSPGTDEIAEGKTPPGAKVGANGWKKQAWGGPCPPIGRHRYFFKLYALDTTLGLPAGASKTEIERAMRGHVLAQAELVGLYQKR